MPRLAPTSSASTSPPDVLARISPSTPSARMPPPDERRSTLPRTFRATTPPLVLGDDVAAGGAGARRAGDLLDENAAAGRGCVEVARHRARHEVAAGRFDFGLAFDVGRRDVAARAVRAHGAAHVADLHIAA